MPRRAVAAFVVAVASFSSNARADAIFALHWRDSGAQTLTILPGDPAGAGQRTLDVVMTLDTRWILGAVTVALPDDSPLAFTRAEPWDAPALPGVTWISFGRPAPLDVNDPILHLGPYQEAYEFVEAVSLPAAPPWGPPGIYRLGSLVIDTSAVQGTASIESLFVPGLDGLGIDDGTGFAVYSDDASFLNATLGTAQLLVVPEPAPAGMLALGLVAFALCGRRSQSRWCNSGPGSPRKAAASA